MGDEKELSSRGYLALGIGYSLLASEGNMFLRKKLRFDRRQFRTAFSTPELLYFAQDSFNSHCQSCEKEKSSGVKIVSESRHFGFPT